MALHYPPKTMKPLMDTNSKLTREYRGGWRGMQVGDVMTLSAENIDMIGQN